MTRERAREWWALLSIRHTSNPGRRSSKKLAAQTLRNILNLVRCCFAQAVTDELIPFNPFAGLKVHRSRTASTIELSRVLRPHEQMAGLGALARHAERWLVAFGLGSGIRQGEQWSLLLSDVHLDDPKPYVICRFGSERRADEDEDGPTKSGRVHRVRLFGMALDAIRRWLALLPAYAPKNPLGLVFPTSTGVRRKKGKKFYAWRLLEMAVGRRIRWHDLRHSCATSLVAGWWGETWTLEAVCRFLDHSSIKVTERYAKLVEELADGAADRMALPAPPSHVAPVPVRVSNVRAGSQQARGNKAVKQIVDAGGDPGEKSENGAVAKWLGTGLQNRDDSPVGGGPTGRSTEEKPQTDLVAELAVARAATAAETTRANDNARELFETLKALDAVRRTGERLVSATAPTEPTELAAAVERTAARISHNEGKASDALRAIDDASGASSEPSAEASASVSGRGCADDGSVGGAGAVLEQRSAEPLPTVGPAYGENCGCGCGATWPAWCFRGVGVPSWKEERRLIVRWLREQTGLVAPTMLARQIELDAHVGALPGASSPREQRSPTPQPLERARYEYVNGSSMGSHIAACLNCGTESAQDSATACRETGGSCVVGPERRTTEHRYRVVVDDASVRRVARELFAEQRSAEPKGVGSGHGIGCRDEGAPCAAVVRGSDEQPGLVAGSLGGSSRVDAEQVARRGRSRREAEGGARGDFQQVAEQRSAGPSPVDGERAQLWLAVVEAAGKLVDRWEVVRVQGLPATAASAAEFALEWAVGVWRMQGEGLLPTDAQRSAAPLPLDHPLKALEDANTALRVERDRERADCIEARRTNDRHCKERDDARAEVERLKALVGEIPELQPIGPHKAAALAAQAVAHARAEGCTWDEYTERDLFNAVCWAAEHPSPSDADLARLLATERGLQRFTQPQPQPSPAFAAQVREDERAELARRLRGYATKCVLASIAAERRAIARHIEENRFPTEEGLSDAHVSGTGGNDASGAGRSAVRSDGDASDAARGAGLRGVRAEDESGARGGRDASVNFASGDAVPARSDSVERTLGRAPLAFDKGDRVRLIAKVACLAPVGSIGVIEQTWPAGGRMPPQFHVDELTGPDGERYPGIVVSGDVLDIAPIAFVRRSPSPLQGVPAESFRATELADRETRRELADADDGEERASLHLGRADLERLCKERTAERDDARARLRAAIGILNDFDRTGVHASLFLDAENRK